MGISRLTAWDFFAIKRTAAPSAKKIPCCEERRKKAKFNGLIILKRARLREIDRRDESENKYPNKYNNNFREVVV